jgi:hypothetical protein
VHQSEFDALYMRFFWQLGKMPRCRAAQTLLFKQNGAPAEHHQPVLSSPPQLPLMPQ